MFFVYKNSVPKYRFLAFSWGSGGFRELQEAYRNHVHLSWYLILPRITSYGSSKGYMALYRAL